MSDFVEPKKLPNFYIRMYTFNILMLKGHHLLIVNAFFCYLLSILISFLYILLIYNIFSLFVDTVSSQFLPHIVTLGVKEARTNVSFGNNFYLT